MPNEKTGCDYKYEDEGKRCPHPYVTTVTDSETGEMKRYCVFHAPVEDEHKKEFLKEFDALISVYRKNKVEVWDFEGFIFPPVGDFFNNKEDFGDYPLNFRRAEFYGELSFLNARFHRNVFFDRAFFRGFADFRFVEFGLEARFDGAIFERGFSFVGAEFKYLAYFSSAKFVSEGLITNQSGAFGRAMFFKEAVFTESESNYPLDFSLASFLGVALFDKIKAAAYISFYSVSFGKQFNAKGAYVSELRFEGTTFNVPPFMGGLGASGTSVTIKDFVGPGLIEFENGIYGAPYKGGVDNLFSLTLKGGEIQGFLSIRSPVHNVDILGTAVSGGLFVKPMNRDKLANITIGDSNLLGEITIQNVFLDSIYNTLITGQLYIRDSELHRAQFAGTSDLRRIDFINVKWRKIDRSLLRDKNISRFFPSILKRTDGIHDEVRLLGNTPSSESDSPELVVSAPKPKHTKERVAKAKMEAFLKGIAENYRAIATSYENRQRYGSAGPFKVGEFEMRRRMRSVSWAERRVLGCYRFFASYGESVWKPVCALLATILIPTMIYFYTGVPKLTREYVPYEVAGEVFYEESYQYETFRYGKRPRPDEYHVNSVSKMERVSDFFSTFSMALKACIPVKTEQLEKITGWPSVIPVFQRGFFIIFTALLLFALRRKTRR